MTEQQTPASVVDGRDGSGETLFGMRVAGWRWKTPIPEALQGSKWGWSYACHWSTPTAHDCPERLFTETDVAALIERLSAEREVLAKALDRQADNMAFLLNHAPIVQGWYDKFTAELAEDRAALTHGESRQSGWQDIATGDLVARHIRRSAEDAGFGLPAAPTPADGGGE